MVHYEPNGSMRTIILIYVKRYCKRSPRDFFSILLVLRMLHFLFTDPGTGKDKAFYDMMRDFVRRHHNRPATTDSFRAVANEHFSRSVIGKKYRLKDLNWFFRQ